MAYNKREKLQENIEAIKVALLIERENRVATEEEKVILRKYSGFGGLKFILNPIKDDKDVENWSRSDRGLFSMTRELFQVLRDNAKTEIEAQEMENSVKRSVNTSFYTPDQVVSALSKALARSGVVVNTFLDPSSGIGRYIDVFRRDNQAMSVTAYEKDILTGKILKALHPEDRIVVGGFETIPQEAMGLYDVSASNIPFGDVKVFDSAFTNSKNPVRRSASKSLHNYFFLKNLDAVREGGLVAFITSRGVMDSTSNAIFRSEMANVANVVSVVRLPDGMFSEEAGTEAGSDLIILQKVGARKQEAEQFSRLDKTFISSEVGFTSEDGKEKAWVNGLFVKDMEFSGYASNAHIIADEVVEGKNMYGSASYEYPFAGDADAVAERLSTILVADLRQNLDIDLYNSHLSEAVKQVAATGEVKRAEVKPKVQQSGPVQLDLFAMWDEQDEEHRRMEPREFQGKMLPHWRNGIYIVDDDQLGVLTGVNVKPIFTPCTLDDRKTQVLRQYVRVRDSYEVLYDTEASERLEHPELREALNIAYDNFFAKYGNLRDRKNASIINMDALGRDVLSLERSNGENIEKADIFDRPVSFVVDDNEGIETVEDALFASLNRFGGVDFEFISEVCGIDEKEIKAQLHDKVYFNPAEERWEYHERFLSGNLYEKIAAIEMWHGNDEEQEAEIQRSLDALRKALPEAVKFDDIDFNFGVRWIPIHLFEDFAREFFNAPEITIEFSNKADTYVVDGPRYGNARIYKEFIVSTEDGKDIDGLQLLQHALQNTVPNITKVSGYKPNGDPIRKPDTERKQFASARIDAIRDGFQNYLLRLPQEEKESLAAMYNYKFKGFVKPKYDGSYLTFPGLDLKSLSTYVNRNKPKDEQKDVELYSDQLAAVSQLTQNGGGYLNWEVGTGKTLAIILSAYKMKQIGMCSKPIIVGIKANIPEIAATAQAAFPNARILYAGQKDFTPANRENFFRNAMNNDWDFIIMTYDQFKKIPQDPEMYREMMMEQIEALDDLLDVVRRNGGTITSRQLSGLEKRKENLEAKLEAFEDKMRKSSDDIPHIGKWGDIMLWLDEAHFAKNRPFVTKQTRLKGIGNPEGSDLANLVGLTIRSIQNRTGKDLGACFFSGTPISNSISELYLICEALTPKALREQNIYSFDSWAAVYGRLNTTYEPTVVPGEFKQQTRLNEFFNIPELRDYIGSFMDYKTVDMIGIKRPKGNHQLVEIEANADHKDYFKRLVNFAQSPQPEEIFRDHLTEGQEKSIMLTVTNLAQNVVLSPVLVNSEKYHEGPDTKLGAVISKVADIYAKTSEHQGVQLIFCDRSTPKPGEWNAYQHIKDTLVKEHGIPEGDVVFMHEGTTDTKRQDIINRASRGEIRILIGSTAKLGTGLNIPRISDMHHITFPYRDSDIVQRNGRGIRTGNFYATLYQDNQVNVYYYAVKGSLDIYLFYLLQTKHDFVDKLFNGDVNVRRFKEGDVDEEEGFSYGTFMSQLYDYPELIEREKLNKDVIRLDTERRMFYKQRGVQEFRYNEAKNDLDKCLTDKAHIIEDIASIYGITRQGFNSDDDYMKAVREYSSWLNNNPVTFSAPLTIIPGEHYMGNYTSQDIINNFGGKQSAFNPDHVVLSGRGLAKYLQEISRREVDDEDIIGVHQVDGANKFALRMSSCYSFNEKTGVRRFTGNRVGLVGEASGISYYYNGGSIPSRNTEEVIQWIAKSEARIGEAYESHVLRSLSLEKEISELEPLILKEWEKTDELTQKRQQLGELDARISKLLGNIEKDLVSSPDELPYIIENDSYGYRPTKITFKYSDYPYISREELRSICEPLQGDIDAYPKQDLYKGGFKHPYGAEESFKKISERNKSNKDNISWLVSAAKKYDDEVCVAAERRLREKGLDRLGRPLSETMVNRHLVTYALGHYSEKEVRALAHGVKDDNRIAIDVAAKALSDVIIKQGLSLNDIVLVPMPGHDGYARTTKHLADAISNLTGVDVVDALNGKRHDSLYDWKKEHPGEPLPSPYYVESENHPIPEGKVPFVIDNVLDTGSTAWAILDAIRQQPILLTVGATGNEGLDGHEISVTYVDNGLNLIKESTPEGVGLTGKSQEELDGLLRRSRQDGYGGGAYEARRDLERMGIDWYTGHPTYEVQHIIDVWDKVYSGLEKIVSPIVEKGSVEELLTDEERKHVSDRDINRLRNCLMALTNMPKSDWSFQSQRVLLIVYGMVREQVDTALGRPVTVTLPTFVADKWQIKEGETDRLGKLRYVEGETIESYMRRNDLDTDDEDYVGYFAQKYTAEEWEGLQQSLTGITKENAEERCREVLAVTGDTHETAMLLTLTQSVRQDVAQAYYKGLTAKREVNDTEGLAEENIIGESETEGEKVAAAQESEAIEEPREDWEEHAVEVLMQRYPEHNEMDIREWVHDFWGNLGTDEENIAEYELHLKNEVKGEEKVSLDKPFASQKEAKDFLNEIGYKGKVSRLLNTDDGLSFIKYFSNGVVTPNIYIGQTTPMDVYRQFHLYGNIMEVTIPEDVSQILDKEQEDALLARKGVWEADRERVRIELIEQGIAFFDVIDCERGHRIVFTEHKNDNGNYTDWSDIADYDALTDAMTLEHIRQQSAKFAVSVSESFDGEAQTAKIAMLPVDQRYFDIIKSSLHIENISKDDDIRKMANAVSKAVSEYSSLPDFEQRESLHAQLRVQLKRILRSGGVSDTEVTKGIVGSIMNVATGMASEVQKDSETMVTKSEYENIISELSEKHHIDKQAITSFVDEVRRIYRIDTETLDGLVSEINGWKERKAVKEDIVVSLEPVFKSFADGREIGGLELYVKQDAVVSQIEESPMMKQFRDLKAKHPDAMLLFRCGDFYETYEQDAVEASRLLDITLKYRPGMAGLGKDNPEGALATFPHHALDTYLPKLIRAGKRVAICDQLEDPRLTQKLVKRGISELVEPGIGTRLQLFEHRGLQADHTIIEEGGRWHVDYPAGYGLPNHFVRELAKVYDGEPYMLDGRMRVRFLTEESANAFIGNVKHLNEKYTNPLFNGLIQKMKNAGIDVVTDIEEGERVLRKAEGAKRHIFDDERVQRFAAKHNLSTMLVGTYAAAMNAEDLRGAQSTYYAIRRAVREQHTTMNVSDFSHLFAEVREELYSTFGSVDALREKWIAEAEEAREVMDEAAARIRTAAEQENERLQPFRDMLDKELDELYMMTLPHEALELHTVEEKMAAVNSLSSNEKQMLEDIVRVMRERRGYEVKSDYQGVGAWVAPGNPGYETAEARRAAFEEDSPDVNLIDIALGVSPQPDDYFTNLRAYVHDDATIESKRSLKAAIDALNGNEDVTVKVYRAVPKDIKEDMFRNGDWVTPSLLYAENHGKNRFGFGQYRIIEQEVPAKFLWWDGNDANEWGYDDSQGYAYKNVRYNRKSNDLITFDDKGVVIPPSQRFDEKVSDLRYMHAPESPVFISNAVISLGKIRQEKATPMQWLGMLEKNGGIKAGEDRWTGLSEWLKNSQEKTLSKTDVLAYLKENMIEVDEVHYVDSDDLEKSAGFEAFQEEFEQTKRNIPKEWRRADRACAKFWKEMQAKYGEDWERSMDRHELAVEHHLIDVRESLDLVENDENEVAFKLLVDRHGDDFGIAFSHSNGRLEISNYDAATYYLQSERVINDTRLNFTTEQLLNKREIALTVPVIESYLEENEESNEIHFGDADEGRSVAWIRFGEASIEKPEYTKMVEDLLARSHEAANERAIFINSMQDKYGVHLNGTFTVKEYNEHLRGLVMGKMTQEERDNYQRLDALWHKADDAVGAAVSDRDNHIERILVIDEIQSKRHQDGRDYGYVRRNGEDDERYVALRREHSELVSEREELRQREKLLLDEIRQSDAARGLIGPDGYLVDQAACEAYSKLIDNHSELPAIRKRLEKLAFLISNNEGTISSMNDARLKRVPEAPFEKNWQEVCMKRMLRYAAENGYDRVAWTTGDQQAERYSLRGKVEWIQRGNDYGDSPERIFFKIGDSTPDIEIDDDGIIVDASSLLHESVGKPLDKFVGKEVAAKIQDAELGPDGRIQGEDLRVGGEGMKVFYDQLLPNYMNKYGKQWGVSVEDAHIDSIDMTMHTVKVNEPMRHDVMQGQPMFFKGENGTTCGFVHHGRVYIDPSVSTAEVPIHEYTHLWAYVLRERRPDEWANIVRMMKDTTDIWEYVEKRYPQLKDAKYLEKHYAGLSSDDALAEEVLAHFSGRRGYKRLQEFVNGKDNADSIFAKVMNFLGKFWAGVCSFLDIHYTNKEDVADRILYDMLNEVNPLNELNRTNIENPQVIDVNPFTRIHGGMSRDMLRSQLEDVERTDEFK